jgi:hypothetical protein
MSTEIASFFMFLLFADPRILGFVAPDSGAFLG